jgi:hypothetical protein
MPNYAVQTVFGAAGNMVSQMQKMTIGAALFGDQASKAFKKAASHGNMFRSIIGGLTAYLSAQSILKFANDSINAFNLQSEAVKNVEAGLVSTSNGVGRTLQQLEHQASSLQANTFFGDEQILKNVTAQMLTFTNITGQQFDRAQKSVLDVTAKLNGLGATGENLKGTSIQLGKALNDVSNLSALSRSGIQFTKEQKTLAERLFRTGRMAEYQNLVLTEIERQYGGTAEALAKTNGGIELSTKNIIGDIQEVIGAGLAPLRLNFLLFAKDIITKAIPYLEKFKVIVDALIPPFMMLFDSIGQVGTVVIQTLLDIVAIFTGRTMTLEDVLSSIASVIKFVAQFIHNFAAGLKVALPWIIGIGSALGLLAIAMNASAIATWAVNVALSANPIGIVIVAIVALISAIGWLSQNWDLATKSVGDFYEKAKPILSILMPPLVAIIEIISAIGRSWEGISNSFKNGDILGGIMRIGGAIVSGLLSPIQAFLELISNIPGLGDIAKGGAKTIADLRAGLEGGYFEQNAPNKEEANARGSSYHGVLDVNAPLNSNYVSKSSGSPPINVNIMGSNRYTKGVF